MLTAEEEVKLPSHPSPTQDYDLFSTWLVVVWTTLIKIDKPRNNKLSKYRHRNRWQSDWNSIKSIPSQSRTSLQLTFGRELYDDLKRANRWLHNIRSIISPLLELLIVQMLYSSSITTPCLPPCTCTWLWLTRELWYTTRDKLPAEEARHNGSGLRSADADALVSPTSCGSKPAKARESNADVLWLRWVGFTFPFFFPQPFFSYGYC